MKRERAKYTNDKGEMAGELMPIKDFLPPPGELVESVTVMLDGDVLAFFQREARQRKTSYDRIIRNLVRSYARSRQLAKN